MTAALLRKETLLVGEQESGQRLDRFLVACLGGVSRKQVKRALDSGQVFLNGRVEGRANRLLQGGETIVLTLAVKPVAEPIAALQVLYRDEVLLAVDKPAGCSSHATSSGGENALDRVRELLRQEGVEIEPILLHRLDTQTTGVLLFALGAAANRELAAQFATRQVGKSYLALVAGAPSAAFSVCNRLKAAVRGRTRAVTRGGQPAETDFRTLAWGDGLALVEARPRTGRTHQIRAHLAGEGYPLLGDILYDGPSALSPDGQPQAVRRQLLHAWKLTVRHPRSGQDLCFQAPLPEDFTRLFPHLRDLPPL